MIYDSGFMIQEPGNKEQETSNKYDL
jgi:hypothetical protein